MILKKQIDPDFRKRELTLDIRPLLSDNNNDMEYIEDEKRYPLTPEIIVTNSKIKVSKNKDKFESMKNRTLKYFLLNFLLYIYKKILILLIYLFHNFREVVERVKRWWINFEKKYSDRTLFFLSISLPENIVDVKDINLYYPLLSQKNCYKLLKIRKEKIKMFNEVFDKK